MVGLMMRQVVVYVGLGALWVSSILNSVQTDIGAVTVCLVT